MKFKDTVAGLIFIALAAFFWKITFVIAGLILIAVLLLTISSYRSNLRIKRFMKENDGKYFLWYSSKKELKGVIESHLKPLFSVIEYRLVYNNKSIIESHLTEEQLRHLRNDSSRLKLPLLIRVKEGQIQTESFYGEVTEYKHEKISKTEFTNRVINKLNKIA